MCFLNASMSPILNPSVFSRSSILGPCLTYPHRPRQLSTGKLTILSHHSYIHSTPLSWHEQDYHLQLHGTLEESDAKSGTSSVTQSFLPAHFTAPHILPRLSSILHLPSSIFTKSCTVFSVHLHIVQDDSPYTSCPTTSLTDHSASDLVLDVVQEALVAVDAPTPHDLALEVVTAIDEAIDALDPL